MTDRPIIKMHMTDRSVIKMQMDDDDLKGMAFSFLHAMESTLMTDPDDPESVLSKRDYEKLLEEIIGLLRARIGEIL